MYQPKTYLGELHPELPFDRACKACKLSNGEAVGGAGPDDLSNIKLIVISDYPGKYETEMGYPFYDNKQERAPKKQKSKQLRGTYSTPKYPTAGGYLRQVLLNKFGLDPNRDCWLTNAVKCSPQRGADSITIKADFQRTCARSHLLTELTIISQYQPTIPILVAGRYAFEAFRHLDESLKKQFKSLTLKKVRRTKEFYLWRHPLIFTFNPATVKDAEFRIESSDRDSYIKYKDKDNFTYNKITKVKRLPNFLGSPRDIFEGDLEFLREFL